jgi:hypothetical protein
VLKAESRAEFNVLLNGLSEYFQPVGAHEEGLVEILAVTRWRQRRLFIAEKAEIESAQEFIEWDLDQKEFDEASGFRPVHLNGGLMAKISNPAALDRCLSLLRILKINVETNGIGRGNGNAESILTRLYGVLDESHWKQTPFVMYRRWCMEATYSDDVRRSIECLPAKECARHFLIMIDEEMTKLNAYAVRRLSMRDKRLELESRRCSVPNSPRLDQFFRYGTTLERTFDRTLSQLERAQRIRLGQIVAPPIDVNVSSS